MPYDLMMCWRTNLKNIFKKYNKLPIQARASFWFLICAFLQKGISIVSTPIFTRLMTTAEYGNYNVFNSWMSVISIFVTLQLYSGVYEQGLVKFEEERDIFSASFQGLTFLLCVIWTGIYLLFRNFWNRIFSLTTVQMLAMLVMIWTTGIFRFWSAAQRVEYKYKTLITITIFVSVAKPIIGIIFVVLAEDKVTARILGLVLVELMGYIALFISQMRKGKVFYSKKYWKYAVMFNIPLVPHYLSQVVLSSFDRIMIKSMVGENEAGIYSLAYSISSIMLLFNTTLSQTIGPWVFKKIKDEQVGDITFISYAAMVAIAFLNILLIALAPEAVAIFAPREYYDAIWVIPPVAMGVYFMFMYDFFSRFEFYFEKTTFIMIASISGAFLNIVLNYVFIKIFGYYAAGYTTLICYITYAIAHYLFMNKITKRYMRISRVYSSSVLFIISIAFIATGFFVMLTYDHTVIRYTLVAMVLVISFACRKQVFGLCQNFLKLKK